MPETLLQQANKAALDSVKAEKPQSFTVGGVVEMRNGRARAEGGLTYDRKLTNLWGLTGYARAYWEDKPIIPTDQFGYVIGGELTRKF